MIDAVAHEFAPDPGYLNTASLGVPPNRAVDKLAEVHRRWAKGQLHPPEFDLCVNRARTAWASISNVPTDQVAIGSTVSEFVGLVAAGLPDGARVVIAQGEFTSLVFPFLVHADRGITVREVPLESLAAEAGRADLVAVSAVQSSDGRLADLAAIRNATTASGARLLVDTTQSAGWLPLDCSAFDFVVCGGYKWLLSPRGTAYLAVHPGAMDTLRPLAGGWYAGEDPWDSIYGSPLRLASSARRFDLSPAWFAWLGAAEALELLAELDPVAVHQHNVALANRFLAALDQPPGPSAIVTVDAAGAERLAAAGVRTAVRAGRVRASFHLYNTTDDVDLAVAALRGG
ncbi:Selenocysteine lyase/Cysteine desulfurase [Nakamurella panacisegetis]|uniref:Selenocysteine lyase/Cysteine desulfurase n=1 Tax=Nakamurella panacisegetis TaxID=1090615 RepID=A0A1H0J9Y6_9ACTN|nr:aminotransferase class V-fold PLP-dependent enzyme [Nakamurella panacisegetis]SDO40496.1 Selenocysteine lyase/Cysteine desulfurase [Nakamurella panacisegetis]